MKRLSARTIYYVISATTAFCFDLAFTTSAIYRFETAGLNPLQLVLVGTVLELSVFIFEIPTGIVADLYSRRISIIIGYGMIGLGLALEGSFPLFATILLAQLIWGTGYTFTSGALDAWLADELGEENLAQVYLRGSQLAQIATIAGIVVGVSIATVALNIPFLIGGGGLVLMAGFLTLCMPETKFVPASRSERNTWHKMVAAFREGMGVINKRPLLLTILGITFVGGLYSEAVDRLWEAHFLANFKFPALGQLDALYWFALINVGTMLISIGGTEYVRRVVDRMEDHTAVRLLVVQTGVLAISLLAFGLATGFPMALIAYGTLAVARHVGSPIYRAWVNRGIDPAVRATVLSVIGQMDAIGQTLGGPLIGSMATRFGLRAAMIVASLFLSPQLALYLRAAGQGPIATEASLPEPTS